MRSDHGGADEGDGLFLTHFKLRDSQGIVAPAIGAADQHPVFKHIHLAQGQGRSMGSDTVGKLRQSPGLILHNGR
jgi:hypothetical protein